LVPEARAPLALETAQKLGRIIAGPNGLRRYRARHLSAVDGEPDALAYQRGAMAGGVAGCQQSMTDEACCDTLRREQTGVILQGTCTGKCRRERRQTFGEAIEIRTGVRVHVGANDADAEAHASLATGKRPGIAGRRDLAAHDEIER